MKQMFGGGFNTRLVILLSLSVFSPAFGMIHHAPVIIPAYKIRQVTRFPIDHYQLFRTGSRGEAVPIPFQIDEINEHGDFVLDRGKETNEKSGDGIFDLYDELSFMGNDVGPSRYPQRWENKPDLLYEIKFKNHRDVTAPEGSVFLGIYRAPAKEKASHGRYVIFDKNSGSITTSRYYYEFDKKNYLIFKKVDMFSALREEQPVKQLPVIDTSVFALKADFKYFLTVFANHRSIDSKLESYKVGPIRTIIRVNFYYVIFKLNFKVGMYTEVSFFSNSVILPAIIDNPLNCKDSLNSGSGFYYGFALSDSPADYQIESNMDYYPPKSDLQRFFTKSSRPKNEYWTSLIGKDKMVYVKLNLSREMLEDENIPYLYRKDVRGSALSQVAEGVFDLQNRSPINLGLYFDLTRFDKGEHLMSFQLFFENKRDDGIMNSYKKLGNWHYYAIRVF